MCSKYVCGQSLLLEHSLTSLAPYQRGFCQIQSPNNQSSSGNGSGQSPEHLIQFLSALEVVITLFSNHKQGWHLFYLFYFLLFTMVTGRLLWIIETSTEQHLVPVRMAAKAFTTSRSKARLAILQSLCYYQAYNFSRLCHVSWLPVF